MNDWRLVNSVSWSGDAATQAAADYLLRGGSPCDELTALLARITKDNIHGEILW